jgi:hypothetical protein
MAWAGAALGAVGAAQQGSAASQANAYNADLAWQNAGIARQTALDQVKQASREHYLRLGDMKANIGKSGGVGGSFIDVLGDTAAQMKLEEQQIMYAGSVKANLLAHGASLHEAAAYNAQTGGYLKAAGELLRGNWSSPRAAGSNVTAAPAGAAGGPYGEGLT